MFNVSANCSPIRPAFGKRDSEGGLNSEKLSEVNAALRSIKDDSFTDEDRAKSFNDLSNKLTEGMRPSSPLKVFIAAVCIGTAGFFLGRKVVGQKVLDVVDKNTKIIDFASKKTQAMFDKFSKIKASDEKTFKGFMTRVASQVSKKMSEFSKKGLDDELLNKSDLNSAEVKEMIAKNFVRKSTTNLGGIVGLGVGIEQATEDKNGDLTPDIFQYKKASGATSLSTVSTIVDTMDVISDLL